MTKRSLFCADAEKMLSDSLFKTKDCASITRIGKTQASYLHFGRHNKFLIRGEDSNQQLSTGGWLRCLSEICGRNRTQERLLRALFIYNNVDQVDI